MLFVFKRVYFGGLVMIFCLVIVDKSFGLSVFWCVVSWIGDRFVGVKLLELEILMI